MAASIKNVVGADATPSSPLSPLQFARGGLVKKRFRRSNLGSRSKENSHNGATAAGAATTKRTPRTSSSSDSSSVTLTTNNGLNSTESSPDETTKSDWWADKRDHFLHWLRCNPLRLGIGADSVKFIKGQLERGDEDEGRRATCWRHVVVELLSTGVPGLDPELLSVAEIPVKAEKVDMAAVLNTLGSTLDGSTLSEDALTEVSSESLKRELVRLSKERESILAEAAKQAESAKNAAEERDAARAERDAAASQLEDVQENLDAKALRISDLEARLASASKVNATSGAAGSGVAAVKALSSNGSPASSENSQDKPASPTGSKASVDLQTMSMLERQEHFLKQRNKKRAEREQARLAKEEEEEKRARDEKLAANKLRTSKWDHVRSRLHEVAQKGGKKQSEVGNEKKPPASSKWGKIRSTVKASAALKAGGKRRGKKKRSSTSSSRNSTKHVDKPSLLEMCTSMLKNKPESSASEAGSQDNNSVPAPPSTPLAPRTPCQSPHPGAQTKVPSKGNGLNAPVARDESSSQHGKGKPIAEEDVAQTDATDANKAPGEEAAPAASIMDANPAHERAEKLSTLMAVPEKANAEGFFAKYGTTDRKGKHVIQDAMPFNIDTFFRKRDKNAGRDGVSLLMARREDNHGSLEAIAVFFDRSKFTEQQAADWWRDNRIRFPNRID